jgi:hypothetical protein
MTKTLMGSPLRKSSRPAIDHTRDWAWVNEHVDEYRGLWVLVCQGRLIKADTNIRQLINDVRREAYPAAMVTYIPTEEEASRVVL